MRRKLHLLIIIIVLLIFTSYFMMKREYELSKVFDETSLIYKCKYLRDNDLGGIMFWDYGEDLTRTLVKAIGTALGKIEDESNVG